MYFFQPIALAHPVLIYGIIFLALVLEGEISLFSAGLLVYFGDLNYFLVLLSVFLGSWLGDMVWYWAGRHWGAKYLAKHGRWLFLSKKYRDRLAYHFQEGQGARTIFFAKFSYGLSHATVVIAGASLMNFKKFIKVDAWTTALWVFIILGLVQFLGHSFKYVKHITKDIGLATGGLVILFILIEVLVTKKANNSL